MSLSHKILLSFASLLWLSACGFSPMYGEHMDKQLAGGFIIEAPNNGIGRELKYSLEDKLNPSGHVPAKPMYKLEVGLTSVASGVGVVRDGTASRYNITLNSVYNLVRLSDNKHMFSGNVRHLASYNNQTNSYFSTTISERDATKRGIAELSEMYRQRMAALLTSPDKIDAIP